MRWLLFGHTVLIPYVVINRKLNQTRVAMNRKVVYVRLLSISSAVLSSIFLVAMEWMWLMPELLSLIHNASQDKHVFKGTLLQ